MRRHRQYHLQVFDYERSQPKTVLEVVATVDGFAEVPDITLPAYKVNF
jgi:hypothetical protein